MSGEIQSTEMENEVSVTVDTASLSVELRLAVDDNIAVVRSALAEHHLSANMTCYTLESTDGKLDSYQYSCTCVGSVLLNRIANRFEIASHTLNLCF